ncbi:MAG: NADH:ubiquinone reductase (Na(+)-transporting) subunit C [Coprobacter sp.]|nr:NADH:ubiquinone reductase (Na(+)-transporting) subunit C [Coprobacter sp.]
MNKQSNAYTIIYASVMVILVAAVLAITSLGLKEKQTRNVEIDKMKQILSSVHIAATTADARALYEKYIVDSFVIDSKGEHIEGVKAFDVNVAVQVKRDTDSRQLPVFVCRLENGEQKYIIPLYGAGLWGPIWGYLAIDSDGNTIYGAYFAHQGETPGLGAEIEKTIFSDQFRDKHLFIAGDFKSIAVEKKGQKPIDGAEYVDAITGGTITSKGVQTMLSNSLVPYITFFKSLQ